MTQSETYIKKIIDELMAEQDNESKTKKMLEILKE